MDKWLPIETAPRDHKTPILAFDGTGMAVITVHEIERLSKPGDPCLVFELVYTGSWAEDADWGGVTHWMPLPPPPNS